MDQTSPPAVIERAASLRLRGRFVATCCGPDGEEKWSEDVGNIVPNAGLNDVLNVYYNVGAATAAFYVGVVDNAGFVAFSPSDTMSSHSWTESVAYSNTPRPTWTPGPPASQAISSSATSNFSISATVTIKGFFLSSDSTKGGSIGLLAATAALLTPQPAASGDTVKVTYTINASTS